MQRCERPWSLWQDPGDKRNANVAPKPEGWSGELRNSQPHFHPWENHGMNPLGTHF